jgi:hypothetical protein
MAFHYKILPPRERMQASFQLAVFGQGNSGTAVGAGQVMVMVMEGVAELQLVLPADLQPLDYAEAFEQGDGAVNAGAVGLPLAGFDDFAHGLGFFISQSLKNYQSGLGQALAVCSQDFCKLFHAANIA